MKIIQRLKLKAKQLKSEVQILVIAYQDKRTPLIAKILIGITVGYLFSPIDLIPDFIPVLGLIDDLIIVPILIRLSIKLIQQIVLNNAREIVLDGAPLYKKSNWLFALVILLIWFTLVFILYKQFKHLWI